MKGPMKSKVLSTKTPPPFAGNPQSASGDKGAKGRNAPFGGKGSAGKGFKGGAPIPGASRKM